MAYLAALTLKNNEKELILKTIVLGDLNSLLGISQPSKVSWLIERGINVNGVQIISLQQDLVPQVLMNYDSQVMNLLQKFPFLERISVALLCWPKIRSAGGHEITAAASTFLTEDLFFYALGICQALKRANKKTGVRVDISYHPMLTWPTADLLSIDPIWHQQFLWNWETRSREAFIELLDFYIGSSVGIAIENEPVTSDQWGNLTHSGNRLFSEQVYGLPPGWGVTADLQHCGMMLECLNQDISLYFPPFVESGSSDPGLWNWEGQIRSLQGVSRYITFHFAQVGNPVKHVKSRIDFTDTKLMDWPLILRLIKSLGKTKGGNVWCAIEEDGGHLYPEGYQKDLEAYLYLQECFGR